MSGPNRDRPTGGRRVLLTDSFVPLDAGIASLAGELSAALIARDKRIEAEDVFIGETAVWLDDAVLTRNAAHFERVDGIEVETY